MLAIFSASIAVSVLAQTPLNPDAEILTETPSENPQTETPTGTIGARSLAPRITLFVQDARNVPFDETIGAATVVDEEIVTAEIIGGRTLRLKGVDFGETLVIVMTPRGRRTLMIEVIGHPLTNPLAANRAAAAEMAEASGPISGSYMVSFSPSFGGVPAFLSQHIEYRQKLSEERTLRVSSDIFNFFGRGGELAFPVEAARFGLNQLSVGISTPDGELDVLDSNLNISPLSFNGYALRGLHLASTQNSRLRGLEVFAGLARPPLTLFGGESGRIMGAMMPLLAEENGWRVRAGFILATPRGAQTAGRSGMVWQADALYNPDEDTKAEAEMNFANGAISWRTGLALHRGAFNFTGEASHLDRHSPLMTASARSRAGARALPPRFNGNRQHAFPALPATVAQSPRRLTQATAHLRSTARPCWLAQAFASTKIRASAFATQTSSWRHRPAQSSN
jgi:hypothetical protein